MAVEYEPAVLAFLASKIWLAVVGVVVWILKKAADKHIESLETLTTKYELLEKDLAHIKTEIAVIQEHMRHLVRKD